MQVAAGRLTDSILNRLGRALRSFSRDDAIELFQLHPFHPRLYLFGFPFRWPIVGVVPAPSLGRIVLDHPKAYQPLL